ncbi:conserved hypothetical protein [Ricinus communis]|uniref:Uncharacterized protein n=1 Tax=Ricinus communis TaxID=3988 RepID=B9SDR0_RICCO|nr:conserved hypothetical protein [Ricinus communis]
MVEWRLRDFNLAMLRKQAWQLLIDPNSLVARLYKERYFLRSYFILTKAGSNSRYIWRSVCEANGLVCGGSHICISNGKSALVFDSPWLPCHENGMISSNAPYGLENSKEDPLRVRFGEFSRLLSNTLEQSSVGCTRPPLIKYQLEGRDGARKMIMARACLVRGNYSM